MPSSLGRCVALAAPPTRGELRFVRRRAPRATPARSDMRNGLIACNRLGDQRSRGADLIVMKYPKLRVARDQWKLAEPARELLVLDHAEDAGLVEQTLQMTDHGQRAAAEYTGHRSRLFGFNARKNSSGSSPRSSTSISAEPTITPSACSAISATCSALRTPNPAQTGSAVARLTASR